MRRHETNSRPAKPLPLLESRLKSYVFTAAAGGIGLGFAAPSAEARIIYTPENKVLTNGTFTLPLDNAGRFTFFDGFKSQFLSFKLLLVTPLDGGAVMVGGGYAQALGAGASIGPNAVFQSQPARMEWVEFCPTAAGLKPMGRGRTSAIAM